MYKKQNRESGYAAFSTYLKPFTDIFNEDQLLIVDGENLITNPNAEFTKIVKFIGLETDHFKFYIPEVKFLR